MKVDTTAQTTTWTYVDGDWHEGNVPLVGPRSHVMWLASRVFDGARWFEGVAPDLDRHAARVNDSALALRLKPTMAAIANAVFDATGVRLRRVPFRAPRVLEALKTASV